MKVDSHSSRIVRSGEFKESNFGVRSQQDLVHIFNVLRNKMYKNKVLAVVREYSTNAQDAHIEAGKNSLPIEVTLPSKMIPYFKVRDYGPGLSDDQVRNIYAMYGASTKRDSNDFNGQLGFGSKAGFSYCDSFNITSYYNGVATSYESYIDETGLGCISEVYQSETSEENGILITVPIKLSDIQQFKETALNFYKYFTPTPHINGVADSPKKVEYLYKGKNWGIVNNTDYGRAKPNVIMGNVCYPLDLYALKSIANNNNLKISNIDHVPIDLYFEIGELNIAASREALEYDKKTTESIWGRLFEFQKEIQNIIVKRIADCSDIVEAKKLFRELNSGTMRNLRGLLEYRHIKWNGMQIGSVEFSIPKEVKVQGFAACSVELEPGNHNGISKSHMFGSRGVTRNHFQVTEKSCVVINDAPSLWTRRCATLLKTEKMQKAYVFTFPDKKTYEDFKKGTYLEDKHFFNLKDYEPIQLPKRVKTYSSKHSAKAFELRHDLERDCSPLSDCWEKVKVNVEKDNGVYVSLYKYKAKVGSKWIEPYNLQNLLFALKQLGFDIKLYGFKQSLVEKEVCKDLKWSPLEAVCQEAINTVLIDPDMQNVVAYNKAFELATFSHRSFLKKFSYEIENSDGCAAKLLLLAKENSRLKETHLEKIRAMNKLLDYMDISENWPSAVQDKEREITRLMTLFNKQYPLLNRMSNNYVPQEEIIQYINCMDRCNKETK